MIYTPGVDGKRRSIGESPRKKPPARALANRGSGELGAQSPAQAAVTRLEAGFVMYMSAPHAAASAAHMKKNADSFITR